MNIEICTLSTNQVRSSQELDYTLKLRTGEAPPEGQYDHRPLTYKVFRVPTALLNEVEEYYTRYTDDLDSDDFDSDGELQQYNEDQTIDKFLRHFFFIERQLATYSVTVSFTVEATSEEDAEEKVNQSINSWDMDWNIISTEED